MKDWKDHRGLILPTVIFGSRAVPHGFPNLRRSLVTMTKTNFFYSIQDTTLWIHIFVQMFAFGVFFPLGMVLGVSFASCHQYPPPHCLLENPFENGNMSMPTNALFFVLAQIVKSRWHVPTQVFATSLAILGYFLGHMHGGREFVPSNVHAGFANTLYFLLAVQAGMGIYLKLHWETGINGKIRKVIKPCHGILGKAFPVLSWTQMLFGGITTLGFCQGDHLGQCLAHFIMGSAFIAYATIMALMLLVGQLWVRRTGRSQEFYDSCVIAAWGCVNTFTEHRWGTAWVRNDWQHTTMGIVWWCAGLAGIWLSRDRDGNPKRNFIPGFVIFITGWAMSAHPQELMISAATHSMFGYNLMAAGVTRIIEISFVLKDKVGLSDDGRQINSFQHIPIFVSASEPILIIPRSCLALFLFEI
jgi:hypothetical protein